jgi:hypothetical protein
MLHLWEEGIEGKLWSRFWDVAHHDGFEAFDDVVDFILKHPVSLLV